MKVTLREMRPADIYMVGQVDRSESIEAEYVARGTADGFGLTLRRVPNHPPLQRGPWSKQGLERRINLWKPKLENGGLLLGAFHGERLVGFAILGPRLGDWSAEVCAMFVDAAYRRKGIGSQLMRALEGKARRRGVLALLIGSNRTASAVEFYLKHGCKVLTVSDNSVIRHPSGDPVFAKEL